MENNFIPFGAQYYRAPTPLEEDWESDLYNFTKQGFNTIKIWAQWRTNNPREGIYDFDDLKRIMDIAKVLNIKVIINIILDVAPAWFYRKYPESIMVRADGVKLLPQTTEYRQVGGAPGPCYHHDLANELKFNFVEELSHKFYNHPALLMWDLWNEPELTCGIAREADEKSMVCYCEATRENFNIWLSEKYKHIDNLNNTWKRNYNSFDEVELPFNPRTFRDMIDWRTFFADTLVNDLESRIKAIRLHDNEHKVMIHTVPPPFFNMVNACCDDYKMAKLCDTFGNSIASNPFPVALNVTSANGKNVINAEIHALGGDTFNRPGNPSYSEFKKHIFTPFSRGIKGFLFWQYRPELLGRESPAWGLTTLDGKSTRYLEYASKINNILQSNLDITFDCMPSQSKIAVIKDNYNEIFTWCATGSVNKYTDSLSGSFNAFYDLNFNVDILFSEQLLDISLDQYKLIYYPLPYYMKSDVSDVIKKWIEKGGVFVSEAFFGGYIHETGLHSKLLPGFGFDKVFGAVEENSMSASNFVAAYGKNWSQEIAEPDTTFINADFSNGSKIIEGYFFHEEFSLTTGKSLGKFLNGENAIVENEYGKGKAIVVGTLLGAAYERTKNKNTLLFFENLTKISGIDKFVEVSENGVRADILYSKSGVALVLLNKSDISLKSSFRFNFIKAPKSCVDADTQDDIEFSILESKIYVEYELLPNDTKILFFR